MKKLIGTLAVAALVASAAFAELNVGAGFNRAVFNVIGYDGDAKTYLQTSWGGNPHIAASLSGSSEQAGFAVDLSFDCNSPFSLGDNCAIWVKPVEWFMLKGGLFYDDTLRGSCCFGADAWGQALNHHGDDLTFQRGMSFNRGVLLAFSPFDGNLYIGIGIPVTSTATEFADVYRAGQYQVGYTIEDLLAIKAQYIGKYTPASKTVAANKGDWVNGNAVIVGEVAEDFGEDALKLLGFTKLDSARTASSSGDVTWGVINAAVDLLMIEDQKISIGAFIPTDSDAYGKKAEICATYNGSFDAISLAGYVQVPIAESWTRINIGVGVGYDFGNDLKLEGEVRADITIPDGADARADISAGVFLEKALANGSIGVGAQIAIPAGDGATTNIKGLTQNDNVHFAIPVKFQVNF